MIAKCVRNSVKSLPDAVMRGHVGHYVHLSEVNLQVGQCYVVFGVAFRNTVPWFLICEEPNDDYPKPHCSAFFELVDAKVDPNWVLSMSQTNVGELSLLPEQWADDFQFLERLVDGDKDAIAYFRRLKSR